MRGRTVAGTATLAVLAAVGAVWGVHASVLSSPPATPANLPAGPAPAPAPAVLDAATGGPLPSAAGVAAALTRALSPALGGQVGVSVRGLDGRLLYSRGGGTALTPASTTKLLTATAALAALGPGRRLATRVVAGPAVGEVTLVGGGDETLQTSPPAMDGPAWASLTALATQTAAQLRSAGERTVRLGYDASLYEGPARSPGWPADYVPTGVVAPVSALTVDHGLVRGATVAARDPARAAATDFAALLTGDGIRVTAVAPTSAHGGPGHPVPAPGLPPVDATVYSPPLTAVVTQMLLVSDDDVAEALAHLVAVQRGEPGTFTGAARATRAILAAMGLPVAGTVLLDGSGLAPADRVSGDLLTALLVHDASAVAPGLAAVVQALPVAGLTGTLSQRFSAPADAAGRGVVRAKTGTLKTVDALAGVVVDASGTPLAFAVVAGSVDVASARARATLDAVATALARCGCGTPARLPVASAAPDASPTSALLAP